jgi:glycosyltransferase involved in cell wall biosynthesis
MSDIQVIVFSKDRPLQLDLTLRSFLRHSLDAPGIAVRVLYKASSSRLRSLYKELKREHANVQFINEGSFRSDLLLLLKLYEQVLFVVDDTIFIRDFSLPECVKNLRKMTDAIGVSLRLGRNSTHCYPLNSPQIVPDLHRISESLFSFQWLDAEHDFAYPLEVSSSLYRVADLMPILLASSFCSPNTLAADLAGQVGRFRESHPRVLCYPSAVAFSAPLNRVQAVCENRSGREQRLSASYLARRFADGWRADVASFDHFTPTGCHQEVDLPLVRSCRSTPSVSVVVPCYKQAEFLAEAIGSVVAQTFTDWELIILDDGSPDDTADVAEKLIAMYPDRSIRLLRKPNGGVSDARNAGIAVARGAYILPLDADDMIQPTMLEKTVQLLDSSPDIAIAYTDITHFGAIERTICAAEFDPLKIPHNNQLNYCSLYRREAWELVGGYKDMFWCYEDWDFWVGCTAAGLRASRIPESLLLYRTKEVSMYTVGVAHDVELRSRIVLNQPELFTPRQIEDARAILQNKPIPETAGIPIVSVIVPTHNRPELLCIAIDSILAQTLENFEIIVVNDAGIDVEPWIASRDPRRRIRVIRHPRNKGPAASRNTGLKAARGRYVAYLDDDDFYYPEHLQTLVNTAEENGVSVACSEANRALYTEKNGREPLQREVIYRLDLAADDFLVSNRLPVLSILHRKTCIDTIGLFDEELTTHEDWDMWVRLFHHFPFVAVHRPTCELRLRINGTSITNTMRPDFYRTMKIIHRRYRNWAKGQPKLLREQAKVARGLASECATQGKPVDFFGRIRCLLRSMRKRIKRKAV